MSSIQFFGENVALFTVEQLAELKKAYASGALRVRFGEMDVTYKSEAEMRRTIERVERELGLSAKVRLTTPKFSKGVGK